MNNISWQQRHTGKNNIQINREREDTTNTYVTTFAIQPDHSGTNRIKKLM
jgi:hypothetical protein